MDLQLAGKTALVTGASVGIGRGIALALASEGVRLAVVARRGDLLETLAGEIAGAGGDRPVAIIEDLMAHIGKHKIYDDITLVVLKRAPAAVPVAS